MTRIKGKQTIAERVYSIVFELLEKHVDGLRWSELNEKILEQDPTLHPKTVNGYVWKLIERYPDKVYKPEKGVFRLTKYKTPYIP